MANIRIKDEDRPKHTPPEVQHLLLRAGRAGRQIGAVCRRMYEEQGQEAVPAFKACWRWPKRMSAAEDLLEIIMRRCEPAEHSADIELVP